MNIPDKQHLSTAPWQGALWTEIGAATVAALEHAARQERTEVTKQTITPSTKHAASTDFPNWSWPL